MGAYRKQSGNLSGTDFYNIPNFKKSSSRCTPTPWSPPTIARRLIRNRCFGFASFLDQIAFELGINPLDMFMRNRAQNLKASCPSLRTI